MDLASAEAEIRHVFGFTSITEASIGAAPPGNNIAQWLTATLHAITGQLYTQLLEYIRQGKNRIRLVASCRWAFTDTLFKIPKTTYTVETPCLTTETWRLILNNFLLK